MDFSPFNVLSLCTGAGGLDLGLRLAVDGARTVGCVEHEAYTCALLAARMEDETLDACPVWTDLRTFDGRPWRGVVDCVTGGYPCQPFSVAGQRRGEDNPRHLWPHVLRIVQEVEPEWCFFENVANHLNLGYREVRRSLEEAGYRVTEGLFTAAEVGAPHRRQRLFILAHAGCGRPQPGSDGPEAPRGGQSSGLPERSSVPLAHPKSLRRQDGLTARAVAGRPAGARAAMADTFPPFPPGPGDLNAWRAILDAAPALEPAVRGVADGLASRVDRLRACGNGVVPLVAAYAFRTLLADLEGIN